MIASMKTVNTRKRQNIAQKEMTEFNLSRERD